MDHPPPTPTSEAPPQAPLPPEYYDDLPYQAHVSPLWHLTSLLSPILFIVTIWMAVHAYKRYGGFNYWHALFFFMSPIATPVYFIMHAPTIFRRGDGSSFMGPSLKSQIAKIERDLIITDTIANHFILGELCFQAKNYPRAEEEFRKILARDPQHQEAQYYMGLCRLDQKDYPEARKFLEPIVTKDRKFRMGVAMLHFSCLLWEEGKKTESLEARRKLARSFPRPLFEYAYADCLVQSGEKEKAKEVLNEMILTAQSAPREDRVWLGKGKKLLRSI